MSTKSCANCAREPSMTKNSSSSRARKTGAQLRDNPEEHEKCGKNAKIPFIAVTHAESVSVSVQLDCPLTLAMS